MSVQLTNSSLPHPKHNLSHLNWATVIVDPVPVHTTATKGWPTIQPTYNVQSLHWTYSFVAASLKSSCIAALWKSMPGTLAICNMDKSPCHDPVKAVRGIVLWCRSKNPYRNWENNPPSSVLLRILNTDVRPLLGITLQESGRLVRMNSGKNKEDQSVESII